MKHYFRKEQRKLGLLIFFSLSGVAVFIAFLIHFDQAISAGRKLILLFTPFYIGFAIAYLLNPILNFWENKLLIKIQKPRLKRVLALIITYALFIGIAGGAIAYILPRLIHSLSTLMNEIPAYYRAFTENARDFIAARPDFNEIYLRYSKQWHQALEKVVVQFSDQLSGLLPKLANTTLQIGNVFIQIAVGIVISIYFLSGKEKLIAQFKKVLNFIFKKEDRYQKVIIVGRITHEKTIHFLSARLLDSLIVAIIAYLFMLLFKMPYALLNALIIGLCNTIPYFGSWIGAVPPALILLIVKPSMLLPYFIFILLLEQLDGNVIGPLLQGRQLGLSALWIIFAIFLFGGLFGFIGMVIGVPFFAVIYYFLNAAINNGLLRQGKSIHTADYAPPEDRDIIEK